MPRGKRNLPDATKDHLPEFKTQVAVMDEPETHFNKEVAVFTQNNVPRYERVRFINNYDAGRELKFFYASGTHPLKTYTLYHDQEYDLPVEVIQHLEGESPNNPHSCQQFEYKDQMTADGKIWKSTVCGYKPKYILRNVRGR